MYSQYRTHILSMLLGLPVILIVLMWAGFALSDHAAVASNFEECAAIGNPIMESHPRQCHSNTTTFIEGGEQFTDVVALDGAMSKESPRASVSPLATAE